MYIYYTKYQRGKKHCHYLQSKVQYVSQMDRDRGNRPCHRIAMTFRSSNAARCHAPFHLCESLGKVPFQMVLFPHEIVHLWMIFP